MEIEDFLLSNGSTFNANPSSNRVMMGPPFQTTGNLNGLNLSLNHGLDLTSPTYGCLNLTQSAMGQHQRGQEGSTSGSRASSMGLNLTAQNQSNQSYPAGSRQNNANRKASTEVGLNLSLQNGMDLSRQTYDFNYHPSTSTAVAVAPNQSEHFEQFHGSQEMLEPGQYHQNSPLNLEQHRSSPLNLTHPKYPASHQNQYFNFIQEGNRGQDLGGATTSKHHQQQQQHYFNFTNNFSSNEYYYQQQQEQPYDYQNQHQQQQPSQQNAKIRLFCQSCSQEFATSNELNKHMEKHNHQLNSLCGTEGGGGVGNQSSCDNNANWNNSNQAMNYSSKEIVVTTDKTSAKPEIVNANEPISTCSECRLHFPTGIDLKKHIDLAHQGRQGGKKYQCLQCLAEFDDIKSHKAHVEGHALEKPFKCDKCGLHLSNASGLKKHQRRVHEKSGPTYQCDQCNKSFFDKFDLSRHVRTHLDRPKCDKCGKVKSHKEKKHVCKPPEPSDPALQCTICTVFLDSKVKWGFHMWKHTKNPAYIQTKPTKTSMPLCLKSSS